MDASARVGTRDAWRPTPGGRRWRGALAARSTRAASPDLIKIARHKDRDRFTSSVWGAALEQGDKLATELIDEAVEALGTGIASALNLLDIEAVIIGGGLGVRFGEPYVSKIGKAMRPHLFPGHQLPAVHLAGLGDAGGAIGAALLVRRKR